MGYRARSGNPKHYDVFEWLANQMKEMLEEEIKGEPIRTFNEILDEREKLLKKDQQEIKKDG